MSLGYLRVLTAGKAGEIYHIGARNPRVGAKGMVLSGGPPKERTNTSAGAV